MSEPFVGEIRIVGFNFAPQGWALCNGQLLAISQNTALFSLLGTFYGGDGRSSFALPNLQSRVPAHQGTGTGLSSYVVGQVGGAESVTLTTAQMPKHAHGLNAVTTARTSGLPTGHVLSGNGAYGNPPTTTQLDRSAISGQGGSQPHENRQPFLVLNFIIALQGIYPARS